MSRMIATFLERGEIEPSYELRQRVSDLGLEKGCAPVTEENIATVAEKGAQALAAVC